MMSSGVLVLSLIHIYRERLFALHELEIERVDIGMRVSGDLDDLAVHLASEMCIRDRPWTFESSATRATSERDASNPAAAASPTIPGTAMAESCLLYTSRCV